VPGVSALTEEGATALGGSTGTDEGIAGSAAPPLLWPRAPQTGNTTRQALNTIKRRPSMARTSYRATTAFGGTCSTSCCSFQARHCRYVPTKRGGGADPAFKPPAS
jgi:hypothetical protein